MTGEEGGLANIFIRENGFIGSSPSDSHFAILLRIWND